MEGEKSCETCYFYKAMLEGRIVGRTPDYCLECRIDSMNVKLKWMPNIEKPLNKRRAQRQKKFLEKYWKR